METIQAMLPHQVKIHKALNKISTFKNQEGQGGSISVHLKLSFLGLLALLPQTRKALSRVLTTLSCSSFLGSKSSTHVISWWSRWSRASLLPVDCVETLSVRARSMVPKSRLISSITVRDWGPFRSSVVLDVEVLEATKQRSKRESKEPQSFLL